MADLTAVPARNDVNALMVAAAVMKPAERALRIPAVRQAARRIRLDLVGLGADLVNTPAGPDRERVRSLADDMTDRLVALDEWEAALVTAQDLDGK